MSPSILLDSFPISHPVEYTDDEDDADDDDYYQPAAIDVVYKDKDFDVETAAQLSSVDGRFVEEGNCKQEGNGKQEVMRTPSAAKTREIYARHL